MFCSKCGNQIKEGQKFCPRCGNKITAVKPAVQEDVGNADPYNTERNNEIKLEENRINNETVIHNEASGSNGNSGAGEEIQNLNISVPRYNMNAKPLQQFDAPMRRKKSKKGILISLSIVIILLIGILGIAASAMLEHKYTYKKVDTEKYLSENLSKICKNEGDFIYKATIPENVVNSLIEANMDSIKEQLPQGLKVNSIFLQAAKKRVLANIEYNKIKISLSLRVNLTVEDDKLKVTLNNFGLGRANIPVPRGLVKMITGEKLEYDIELPENIYKLKSVAFSKDAVELKAVPNYDRLITDLTNFKNSSKYSVLYNYRFGTEQQKSVYSIFSKSKMEKADVDNFLSKLDIPNINRDFLVSFLAALSDNQLDYIFKNYGMFFERDISKDSIKNSLVY